MKTPLSSSNHPSRFLGAKRIAKTQAEQVIILGAPFDLTVSFRSGARLAPQRIREVSESIETYSPRLHRALEDLRLADGGDIKFDVSLPEDAISRIEEQIAQLKDTFPFLIGGDHTITLGAVRALKTRYPSLLVIQFDAHIDLRDTYDGSRFSHATVARRIAEELLPGSLIQLGVRSGTAEEFELARRVCLISTEGVELSIKHIEELKGRPIYVTVDIDVLDPAYAPGTGNPEPGGVSYQEMINALYTLRPLNIVGMDLVEVCPPCDPSDVTSITAAKIIREAILAFVR